MATPSLDTSTRNFILCLSLHCLRIRPSSINSSFASHFHSMTFATQHRQLMEAIMIGTKLLKFQRILVYLPFHPFLPSLFLSSFLPSFCLPFSPFSSFFLLFFSKKYTYYTVFTFFFVITHSGQGPALQVLWELLGNIGLSLLLCFPDRSVICLGLSMSLTREKWLYFLAKHLWC